MPWFTPSPMSQRVEFVHALLSGRTSMRALCRQFGISEKTGYKWRARFLAGGPAALADRSHAPHVPAHRVAPTLRHAIVALREAHPTWGARKLRAVLQAQQPTTEWPAPSTITTLLGQAGLLAARRRRSDATRRWPVADLTEPTGPNDVWTADFKGEFRLRTGEYCYPLTVADLHARFLLACAPFPSTASEPVMAHFTTLFQRYGLPRVIRTDNGVPFGQPNALGRLSRLAVWWIRLGIRPERTTPSHPQENGAHERMHRTLKAEATRPASRDWATQTRRLHTWQHEYNTLRPHEALGQTCPAQHYVASDRRWPRRLPPLVHPAEAEVRRVSSNGSVRFGPRHIFLTATLAHEYVAFTEVADAQWTVSFGPLQLGVWAPPDDTFTPAPRWLDDTALPSPASAPVSPIIPV